MQYQAGKWKATGYVPGIHRVERMMKDGPDMLWLTNRLGTVTRFSAPSLNLSSRLDSATLTIEQFGEDHGLGKGWVRVWDVNGKIVFATSKGLRHFDAENKLFQLDSSFGGVFADTTWFFGGSDFHIDSLGHVLTARYDDIGIARPAANGGYSWDTTPFLRFADFGGIWTSYLDENYQGVYWFGGASGIVR